MCNANQRQQTPENAMMQRVRDRKRRITTATADHSTTSSMSHQKLCVRDAYELVHKLILTSRKPQSACGPLADCHVSVIAGCTYQCHRGNHRRAPVQLR